MEAYALFEHLHLEMIGWPTADRDEHITVLEGIGYKVGLALCQRLCKDKPRFKEELDIIKFICQDFWVSSEPLYLRFPMLTPPRPVSQFA